MSILTSPSPTNLNPIPPTVAGVPGITTTPPPAALPSGTSLRGGRA